MGARLRQASFILIGALALLPGGAPAAALILRDTVVRDNTAIGGHGGGIDSHTYTALVEGSVVTGNTAGGHGGGVWNDGDPDDDYVATINRHPDSSVTGNTPDDCFGTPAC